MKAAKLTAYDRSTVKILRSFDRYDRNLLGRMIRMVARAPKPPKGA